MKNIMISVIYKLKQIRFRKTFYHIGEMSGFGTLGFGNTCMLMGKDKISVGNNTWFGNNSELLVYNRNSDNDDGPFLIIGNGVNCTCRCRITCAGHIRIENHVLIAPDVFITDHNHGMDPREANGYSAQPLIIKDVHIGTGAWLGQRTCILPGVTVGNHSIIGAGSIVTHDIPPYTIAAGAPANVIKKWNFDLNRWVSVTDR